jgi:hypothetical protein
MVPSSENVTAGTMQDDTQMTLAERRQYLEWMRPRYLLADCAAQSRLPDDLQALTGMERKACCVWCTPQT